MALVTWGFTALGIGVAHADGPIDVVGFTDLLPHAAVPPGSAPSLFEATNGLTWLLHRDPSPMSLDYLVVGVMNDLVNIIWGLALLLAQAALYLGQWVLSLSAIPGANEFVTDGLGTTATTLMSWLAPSAIVIGLLVAFIQYKGGEAFNQIAWVLVSATIGMSLALTPALWTNGAQTLRTLGTDAVLTVASPAAAPDQSKPFEWAPTDYAGATPRDSMLRKANDSVFRGLIVYPWCIAEFGSLQACAKYGPTMLAAGTDTDKRQKAIADVVRQEGGDSAPTSRWLKGYNWPERLVTALAALLVTVIFCGLLLVLAFAAIGALISVMFHLLLGALFTLTWCIPGRPRQIGMAWLQSLIGTVLQGVIAVGIFGATLTILTLIYSNVAALGGVIVTAVLAITAAGTALGFRSQVASWFGVVAGGRAGAAMLGAAAMRLATRAPRAPVDRSVAFLSGPPPATVLDALALARHRVKPAAATAVVRSRRAVPTVQVVLRIRVRALHRHGVAVRVPGRRRPALAQLRAAALRRARPRRRRGHTPRRAPVRAAALPSPRRRQRRRPVARRVPTRPRAPHRGTTRLAGAGPRGEAWIG